MIPKIVEEVLDKPGKYVFSGRAYSWVFEVDEKGQVHQISPWTGQRDGVLEPGGWFEEGHDPENKVLPYPVRVPAEVCKHQWDGPWVELDGGRAGSITCSKCGMTALSHDLRYGP